VEEAYSGYAHHKSPVRPGYSPASQEPKPRQTSSSKLFGFDLDAIQRSISDALGLKGEVDSVKSK